MRRLILILTIVAASCHAQDAPQPITKLHQFYLDDAHDMPANTPQGKEPSPEDLKAWTDRGAARRSAVRIMVEKGEVMTGQDLAEAALIFQHGETAADYLFAHVLATDAVVKGNDEAKWLAAATLDRYLQLIGQPQIFGTQYPLDPNRPHPVTNGGRYIGRTQVPFDERLLPPTLRKDFCVPDLQQQKQNLEIFDSGKYPRDSMVPPGCSR